MAVDGYRISETRSGSSQEVKDFKVVRLGRTIRISKASFDDWLNNLL